MDRVIFGSFHSISIFKGGIYTQLIKTKEALEKKGVKVELFDQWKEYKREDLQYFHLFGADLRTYYLGEAVHRKGGNVILSSVYYREINPYFLRLQNKILNKINHLYSSNKMGKKLSMIAKIILPNSKAEANYIQKAWGVSPEKIFVVPNGVDTKFKDANPDYFYSKYGIKDFLLGVGTLSHRKNYDLLARLAYEEKIPLVLIGELGNTKKSKSIYDYMQRCKHIIHIPHLNHDHDLLASAYAAAHSLVLPSDFETPGLVALEAGLAGSRIVITEVGGTKEYFGDYADYVKPRDYESLKRGVLSSLNKKKDENLKWHILNNFTWDHVASKTLEAYSRVILR
ncbi:glycosyltransferase family 4 protein [Caldibacillus debilis]|uniref:glycosyltransferase family 4 protein n=1 Tax=Caldibacillus debilis TaxID=301148 RepID=UPI0003689DC2|nr:glycosyltransferase family 4 protein [Caldibacillus debilis]